MTDIPDNYAEGRSDIECVVIPESIQSIGKDAFKDCVRLKSISFPEENLDKIGDHAFDGCSALESITIPYGVTKIGEQAFCNCKNLRSAELPDSLQPWTETVEEEEDACPYFGNSHYVEVERSPIGLLAFYGCPNLTFK